MVFLGIKGDQQQNYKVERNLFRSTLVDYSHFNLLKHTVPGNAGYKQLVA